MGLLGRDAIIAAVDLETADVEVPEWGGSVRVRTITAQDRERFSALSRAEKDAETDIGFQALFVAFCAVDEAGALLFPSAADRQALAGKNAYALSRVFLAAWKLNRMGSEKAPAVEEAEKN